MYFYRPLFTKNPSQTLGKKTSCAKQKGLENLCPEAESHTPEPQTSQVLGQKTSVRLFGGAPQASAAVPGITHCHGARSRKLMDCPLLSMALTSLHQLQGLVASFLADSDEEAPLNVWAQLSPANLSFFGSFLALLALPQEGAPDLPDMWGLFQDALRRLQLESFSFSGKDAWPGRNADEHRFHAHRSFERNGCG